jgi:hypothetical protein
VSSSLTAFYKTPTGNQALDGVQTILVRTLLLTNQVLTPGANSINHGLNRTLVGWILTRVRAASTIYDTQDTNTTPKMTLDLNSSAAVTVDIYVF